ncbi:MAG: carbon-nitrogen hydrolase family protein [Rhodospirillaceae bacterium]
MAIAPAFTAACIQVCAGPEIGPNVVIASELVRRARDAGADFIALPENVALIVQGRDKVLARVRPESDHPALAAFRDLAQETGAWLLVGSLGIALDDGRVANRSFLLDAAGGVVARYDKIHMFDVDLPGGESYRESATFRPGARAVVADAPFGCIGMTICYDLRFAYLFRALARAGAGILTVPAAFTVPTGRAHWHVLLRARAIETGCFVIAPAQCGTHDEGRQTFGHSLIISPWGEILAEAGEDPGVITARIDMAKVEECRGMVPALRHDRAFEGP